MSAGELERDIAWCRFLFGSLADGGSWGVPRSGLIFEKRGDELVLIARMPYMDEMAEALSAGADVPPHAEALRAYQDADYGLIRDRFERAGVTVREDVPDGDSA